MHHPLFDLILGIIGVLKNLENLKTLFKWPTQFQSLVDPLEKSEKWFEKGEIGNHKTID